MDKNSFWSLGKTKNLLVAMAWLGQGLPGEKDRPKEAYSGGDTTRWTTGGNAFNLPSPNLTATNRASFFVGDSFFKQNWIAAPASASARDGVGPFFNARSCSACHQRDGRGKLPDPGEPAVGIVVKVSSGVDPKTRAPIPHPTYGLQIQNFALPGLKPEAVVKVAWESFRGKYDDGSPYELKKPIFRITDWLHGAPAPSLKTSARLAPQVFGMGLLQAIPESTLRAWADPKDSDGNGISGKLQKVGRRGETNPIVGRFGWKAEQPTVRQQTAEALGSDMGLSSSAHPRDLDHGLPVDRAKYPSGGSPEVEDKILDHLAKYPMLLAVPGRRNTSEKEVLEGKKIFEELQCAACHKPTARTGKLPGVPEVSDQEIQPFTDLLLHDMGPELADALPAYEAAGSEWRTPPLWGLGLFEKVNGYLFLLHDGRARTIEEAILWHGGEAENSAKQFKSLNAKRRSSLIQFLKSL